MSGGDEKRPKGRASAPPSLEYSSAPLSPFDRPVEPLARKARTAGLVLRITYWVFGLAALAWLVWHFKRALDSIGQ